jgi:hypothetical protein
MALFSKKIQQYKNLAIFQHKNLKMYLYDASFHFFLYFSGEK